MYRVSCVPLELAGAENQATNEWDEETKWREETEWRNGDGGEDKKNRQIRRVTIAVLT